MRKPKLSVVRRPSRSGSKAAVRLAVGVLAAVRNRWGAELALEPTAAAFVVVLNLTDGAASAAVGRHAPRTTARRAVRRTIVVGRTSDRQ